jgi:16S rRNA (guanine527-N7)-methyltransferase
MQRLLIGAAQMGVRLSPSQATAFEKYTDELLSWNERFNLTAVTDREQVQLRHYLDSLALLPVLAAGEGIALGALLARPLRVADVGAGAGLPGLALRIAWPRMRLTLIESTGKKVRFLRHVVDQLGINDVEMAQGRAEELALRPPFRAGFDLVLARAVAPLPTLAEYLLPLARRGGCVVAYKGSAAHEEAMAAEYAVHLLGGRLRRLVPVEVPGLAETRVLVIIDKVSQTPEGYPRGRGLPRKQPLGCPPAGDCVPEAEDHAQELET